MAGEGTRHGPPIKSGVTKVGCMPPDQLCSDQRFTKPDPFPGHYNVRMLDIVLLRKDLDAVVARLQTRKNPQSFLNVEAFRALEGERKTLQTRTEELQSQRNSLSKQIGMLKGKGQHAEADAVMAQVGAIKDELDASAQRLEVIQAELQTLLLAVPNLPHESVPVGADEHGNIEVRR